MTALRIAGVLARSNPYGIMKSNDGKNRFDVQIGRAHV